MVWLGLFCLATKCRLKRRLQGSGEFFAGLKGLMVWFLGPIERKVVAVIRYSDFLRLLVSASDTKVS
jgi:hypothetical protein